MKFSTKWCVPCKKLDPILDAFAEEREDVRIQRIDAEENVDLASKFGVKGVPFCVFKDADGNVVGTHSGLISKKSLAKLVDSM